MSSSRHLSRVLVLQALFAYEFHGGDPEAILQYTAQEFAENSDAKKGIAANNISESTLAFAYELLNGVLRHVQEIQKLIVKNAPAWPIDKIGRVDRAALEIAIFEMFHSKDVPEIVAIDEAIELAKTFGNENSQKFVNGVLNAILQAKGSSASEP